MNKPTHLKVPTSQMHWSSITLHLNLTYVRSKEFCRYPFPKSNKQIKVGFVEIMNHISENCSKFILKCGFLHEESLNVSLLNSFRSDLGMSIFAATMSIMVPGLWSRSIIGHTPWLQPRDSEGIKSLEKQLWEASGYHSSQWFSIYATVMIALPTA